MFILIILDLQQNTLTIFLMPEPNMANLISIFKVQLCGMLLMMMSNYSPLYQFSKDN